MAFTRKSAYIAAVCLWFAAVALAHSQAAAPRDDAKVPLDLDGLSLGELDEQLQVRVAPPLRTRPSTR